MFNKQIKVLIPKLSDPRFLFLLFTYTFLAYVLMLPGYGRVFTEYLYLATFCVVFDLLLRKLMTGTWAVPISGLIAAFGTFIVTDVADKKYYILLAFLAIGSKAFLKINNRHIFNPGNFAITLGTFCFPTVICPGGLLRWDGNLSHSLLIFILGTILAIRASRWAVAFSFILTSLIVSPLQNYFAHENYSAYIHTLMWQGSIIFIFFMITDPITSPNRLKYQFIFGTSVALFAQTFRYLDIRTPEHIALITVCLFYALIDKKLNDKKNNTVWKTKEVLIGPA